MSFFIILDKIGSLSRSFNPPTILQLFYFNLALILANGQDLQCFRKMSNVYN